MNLHISPYFDDSPYLSIFSLNADKYGPVKLQLPTLFTHSISSNLKQCQVSLIHHTQKIKIYELSAIASLYLKELRNCVLCMRSNYLVQ